MTNCPHCDQPHHLHDQRLARYCPWCGADMPSGEDEPWTVLLRLHHAAEVGFLAEQLEQHGIESRMSQHDEFSAVDGTWQIRYLLLVHQDDALEAAQTIKHVLDAPDSEIAVREQYHSAQLPYELDQSEPVPPGRGVPWWAWTGIVLSMLAMGGYFLDREPPEPLPEPNNDKLLEVLRASGARWTRPRTETQPGLSFYFNERDHTWVLDEDTNGDQVPERRRKFQGGELVFDSQM